MARSPRDIAVCTKILASTTTDMWWEGPQDPLYCYTAEHVASDRGQYEQGGTPGVYLEPFE